MSASEKLRELSVGDGLTPYALEDTLPEIIAVVEAAETYPRHDDLEAALTALEEKLDEPLVRVIEYRDFIPWNYKFRYKRDPKR